MAKRKTKINSCEELAPPPPRSLRTRKRECPIDEISLIDDVQALHQQDTEENNTAAVSTPLQCPQYPLQECAMITDQQHQAAELPCVTKQEKDSDATNDYFKNEAVTGQEVTNPKIDSQLEQVLNENDTNKSGMEDDKIASDGCNRSVYQTCTDQFQVFSSVKEESDKSCPSALGKNQETHPEETMNVCLVEVKEITKDTAVGLPAKKKRRMDGPMMELNEAELKLQTSHREGDERTETDVLATVTPSCSEGKGCEPEGGTEPGPEQTGNPDQLAEAETGGHLEIQMLQEAKGYPVEVLAIIPKKQEEDGSAKSNCISVMACCACQEKTSDSQDALEATLLQVNNVNGERDQKKEEMTGDVVGGDGADVGASYSDTQPVVVNHGFVALCEAAVTPSVSERKDCCDPVEPSAGPSVNTEHTWTRDTGDSFGSGCLDYVSDSQLNTIVLIEEEVMLKEDEPHSSDYPEDATDLICGLIRELSSLNRMVMASHRELESLRRDSKRSSTR